MSSGSLTSHGFIYIKFKNRQNVYMLLEVRRGICLEGGSRMCSVCEDASSCTIMICLFFYMYVIVLKKVMPICRLGLNQLIPWFNHLGPKNQVIFHVNCHLADCFSVTLVFPYRPEPFCHLGTFTYAGKFISLLFFLLFLIQLITNSGPELYLTFSKTFTLSSNLN